MISARDKRYLLFVMTPALVLLTSFAGPFYGWNAIVVPINKIFGGAHPETDWPGVLSGGLVLFSIFFGTILHRYVVRKTNGFLRLLLTLYVAGYFLIALSCSLQSLGLLMFSAVYLGTTQGLLYIHMFADYIEWFRRWGKIGLGSGIIGCFLGLWPALHSAIADDILLKIGLNEFLMAEGLVVLALGVLGSVFWRSASEPLESTASAAPLRWATILKEPRFWFYELFLMSFLLPGFGFKIVMQVVLLDTFKVSLQTASHYAAAFLLSYAFSRLVFGYMSDRIPPRSVFLMLCVGQVICLIAASTVVTTGEQAAFTFVVLMCAVGALFAAGKTLWAVGVYWLWGPKHYGQLMGPSMFAFSLAGLLGPISLNQALRGTNTVDDLQYWLLIGAVLLLMCFGIMWRLMPRAQNA
jgi:nitrate/nitrite transporter NarK